MTRDRVRAAMAWLSNAAGCVVVLLMSVGWLVMLCIGLYQTSCQRGR